MDVLARIPELPSPRPAAAVYPDAAAGERRRVAVAERPMPVARVMRRWSRIQTVPVTTLAVVAAVIWGLVAWRERQDARDARAAVRLARQVESTPVVERAR